MNRINISDPEFALDGSEPEGFATAMARVGPGLGAKQTGASVYELPPGQALCPYHYEYAEEEWLLVLEGNPTVRDPDGEHRLEVMDLVFFPTGPEGAHRVQNDSEQTARVLMWSPVIHPAATVYPDSDKIGIWTGNKDDDVLIRRSSGVGYWDGEGPDAS
ncbi:MAG: cupin domain-containing protein [Solirubrobacterales bacterium]